MKHAVIDGPEVAQVLDVGGQWAQAELHGDTEALQNLLSAGFIGVGPLGFQLDRRAWLQRHSAGGIAHESLTWQDVEVHVYGDVAHAVGVQTTEGSYAGKAIATSLRITLVLVRSDGAWQIDWLRAYPMTAP